MKNYLNQLLSDIQYATDHAVFPFTENGFDLMDWVPDEEENRTAPVRSLEEWTGIYKEQLPPSEKLSDEQIAQLLNALIKMLDAYNCSFVLQTEVPHKIQYETIRENFNQFVKVKRIHMGFFSHCHESTVHKKCTLGEFCQCAFYEDLFSRFKNEELSTEEERKRQLEIETSHLQRKYGEDWMKYYPYHLDAAYDDENGNPYNYGFEEEDDNDEKDDWWMK